ncbi:MAG: cation transporter [Alphaproteobacteria bacterium]|nr:cation transporter [Alphaproteobacteria bacterium]
MATAGTRSVRAALISNLLVAATKAIAAFVTGSSAMLAETIHSIVDTGNQLLMLHGIRRSQRRPDSLHPIGYGRELYFWSFIVALLLFGAGACVSVIEGIMRLQHPRPIENPIVSYIVLTLSLIFEGSSWTVAYRNFRSNIDERGYWAALRESRDPSQTVVLLEDSAAVAGIFIALVGTWLATAFEQPQFDGLASILIGILLAAVSVGLARQSKNLLIGERADDDLGKTVFELAQATPGVVCPNNLITVQVAPDQVTVLLSLEFDDALRVPQIEKIVAELENRIRNARPDVLLVFVKPQTKEEFARARTRFLRGPEQSL